MIDQLQMGDKLPSLVERIVASYKSDNRTHHIDRVYLPSRREITDVLELLLELVYPGYYGRQNLTTHNVAYHVGELLPKIGQKLFRQVYHCLCYGEELAGRLNGNPKPCDQKARQL